MQQKSPREGHPDLRVCSFCVFYRFRSESNSFVQSTLTIPAPSLLTSTLCSILRTSETSTASVPQSADPSLGSPELGFPSGSNPVDKNNTPDSCSNKDNDVPEKKSPLQIEHNSQYNPPQRRTGTQIKITQNVATKGETLPQMDPIPQAAELNHSPTLTESSYCPQPFNGPDPDLQKDKTSSQVTRFLKCSSSFPQTITAVCFPQSLADYESGFHQDINIFQTRKETPPVSKTQKTSLTNTSTSTITKQTIYLQSFPSVSQHTLTQASSSLSSPQKSSLSQSETLPQIDPVPQPRRFAQSPSLIDSVLHKDRTQDTEFTTIPHDSNLSLACPDSRSGLDQDVPSSQTSKETSSVSMPQSSNLTTATTVNQTHICCQSSPPNSHDNVPENSNNSRSQQGSPFSQGNRGLPEVHASIHPEPNSVSNISISSSAIEYNSKQSHQTVYSLHESLASTCTQQCMHDPGMTHSSPAKPTAAPRPESQTQALAQQSNLHDTPLSSPPHLLTPNQDPNICQPMVIREEIRLTPQIKGPPRPAPTTLPQAQAESLPQGKASKSGPPCFTRPLSRATVMEGSPVTLEVEVTAHPEPTLSWWVAYNQLHNNTQALLDY